MPKKESITIDILEGWGSVEIWVTYDTTYDSYHEEGHGLHSWQETEVDITYVEINIAGELLKIEGKDNFLPYLSKKQLQKIESLLH